MGLSRIFGSIVKATTGDMKVQHLDTTLNKELSAIVTIDSVEESKAFIVRGGMISNKGGVYYSVNLISPTEVEVLQNKKKATTTVFFSVVSES